MNEWMNAWMNEKKKIQDKCKRMEPSCEASEKLKHLMKLGIGRGQQKVSKKTSKEIIVDALGVDGVVVKALIGESSC